MSDPGAGPDDGALLVLDPSALSWRDVLDETLAALVDRPSRTVLTALGTVLGVAALVATLGLADTAGSQIIGRFDELAATTVSVAPAARQTGDRVVSVLPFDAEDRLTRLNGVVAAGTLSTLDLGGLRARSVPVVDPTGAQEVAIPVVAVSPGLFRVVRAEVRTGILFDHGHDARRDAVAVLGPGAAERLGVHRVDTVPAVFIGDQALAVVGVLSGTRREPSLLNAVIVPDGFARDRFDLQAPAEVLIETEVGAAELIGGQAPIALAPNQPEQLRANVPASPSRVRAGVEGDVDALFLVLGGVSLLVGAIGIANVTLVSVLERTGEIGLRRALGATRRHIAVQFLAESAVLGFLGGLFGTTVGVLTVVGVSALRTWTPVLEPWLPFAAPVLGAVIGLVAGTYPAWKAASLEPIAALRAGAG